MTLDKLRPLSNRAITPFVALATRLGLSANVITITSIGTAAMAAYALVRGGTDPSWYLAASAFVLFTGFLDVLDGAVARSTGTDSEFGDFLDHVLDRYGDVLVLGGLAVGTGQYLLGMAAVSGVLLTAYLGTQGDALGLGRIYGGLLGRADILVIVGAVTAVAAFTNPVLYDLTLVEWSVVFFAIFTHVTALQRFVWSWQELRADG